MNTKFAKLGSIFYGLWGAIHVLGGAFLLSAAFTNSSDFLQVLFGSSQTITPDFLSAVPAIERLGTTQVFTYHAFNLLWIGLLVTLIAAWLNWNNSPTGFWLNLTLVGLTDLGLVLFMVQPGVIPLSDAWIGPALYIPAIVFSALGVFRAPGQLTVARRLGEQV